MNSEIQKKSDNYTIEILKESLGNINFQCLYAYPSSLIIIQRNEYQVRFAIEYVSRCQY